MSTDTAWRPAPDVRWETAKFDGQNIVALLSVQDPRPHLLVLPPEAASGKIDLMAGDPVRLAKENQNVIRSAVGEAWQRNELREAFEIGGPGRNVQLCLTAADFER